MTLTLDLGEMQIQSLRYISNSTVMYKCSQTPTWKYGLSLQKDPVSGDAKSPLLVWIGPDIRVSIIFRGPKVLTFSEITGSPPKVWLFHHGKTSLWRNETPDVLWKPRATPIHVARAPAEDRQFGWLGEAFDQPCEVGRMPCDHIMLLKLLPIHANIIIFEITSILSLIENDCHLFNCWGCYFFQNKDTKRWCLLTFSRGVAKLKHQTSCVATRNQQKTLFVLLWHEVSKKL